MPTMQTRREFLTALSLAGAAGLVRPPPVLAAEGALETTTVRIAKSAALCVSPQYVAEELLRAEGFTEILYVSEPYAGTTKQLARGEFDFDTNYASNYVRAIDAGEPITILAGIHVGCFELFGNEGIRSITDLKGKSVEVQALGSNNRVLVTLMAAQVGLDPVKDIHWVTDPKVKPIERFVDGKIDAFLGFPPEPQELRARHIGHVVVNTAVDRPWSQYFCCLLGGNADYVRAHPVATKRCCARSSKQRISALPTRHALRDASSMEASRRATTMPSRR
jgi:NitT/TauT family transport system substrate-binding protein